MTEQHKIFDLVNGETKLGEGLFNDGVQHSEGIVPGSHIRGTLRANIKRCQD